MYVCFLGTLAGASLYSIGGDALPTCLYKFIVGSCGMGSAAMLPAKSVRRGHHSHFRKGCSVDHLLTLSTNSTHHYLTRGLVSTGKNILTSGLVSSGKNAPRLAFL